MTPDELAAIVRRDAIAPEDWLPLAMPRYARAAFEDRRALLGLLRETRARLRTIELMQDVEPDAIIVGIDAALSERRP